MTLNKLASLIAKREGKKSQARIGDIREILKIIVTLEAECLFGGKSYEDCPMIAIANPAEALADKLIKRHKKRGRK